MHTLSSVLTRQIDLLLLVLQKNYCLISIFTCFSKIFERLIYKRVNNILNKHNVIINTQYGFQNKVSTNHGFIDIITNSYDNINSNQFTGLVFLEFTKAFDSINHDILLLKLQHFDTRGSANQLLQLFLSRKQFVSIKGAKSKLIQNKYDVPSNGFLALF